MQCIVTLILSTFEIRYHTLLPLDIRRSSDFERTFLRLARGGRWCFSETQAQNAKALIGPYIITELSSWPKFSSDRC